MRACHAPFLHLVVLVLAIGCESETPSDESPTTSSRPITLWHFWSEPHQQRVLDSMLQAYSALHPSVEIEAVPLSWSDGKAKLQLAFNSGEAPDIVHIGLDWFASFDDAGVFASLPIGDSILNGNGRTWCVNARLLVATNTRMPLYRWGLVASDDHNVIKRVLPIIWQRGSPNFYRYLPISSGMDSSLVDALWEIAKMSNVCLVARSKNIDQAILEGTVGVAYTGPWIFEMARDRGVNKLTVAPSPSILNGDVLAVNSSSDKQAVARELVSWLTAYPQAREFCLRVPDAGYPSGDEVFGDAAFSADESQRNALQTIRLSSPLPISSTMLEIEPIIEGLIESCYAAKSRTEVEALVAQAREAVVAVEQ